jgi:hypothetical protein
LDETSSSQNDSEDAYSVNSSQERNEMTPSGGSLSDVAGATTYCKKKRLESEMDVSDGNGKTSTAFSQARRQLFPDDQKDDSSSRDAGSGVVQAGGSMSDASSSEQNGDQKTESNDLGSPQSRGSKNEKSTAATDEKSSSSHLPVPAAKAVIGCSGPLRPLCGTSHFIKRSNAVMTCAKRPSYKLVDIHKRVVGQEPTDSHRAEDDCVTLARIFWLTHKAPLWADCYAVPFSRFRPLYVTRRRPLPPGKFPCSC